MELFRGFVCGFVFHFQNLLALSPALVYNTRAADTACIVLTGLCSLTVRQDRQRSEVVFFDCHPNKFFYPSGFAGWVPDCLYYIGIGFSVEFYSDKHSVFSVPTFF